MSTATATTALFSGLFQSSWPIRPEGFISKTRRLHKAVLPIVPIVPLPAHPAVKAAFLHHPAPAEGPLSPSVGTKDAMLAPPLLRRRGSLKERLYAPSPVTTMETKYHVHSHVAEFWCTVTSAFIALPILLYLMYPMHVLPTSVHASIAGSVACAIASTIYHTTNQRIWSAMDVSLACTMIHLSTLSVLKARWPEVTLFSSLTPWVLSTIAILAYLLRDWENTAGPAIRVMCCILPLKIVALTSMGSPTALLSIFFGVSGIICFLADRKQFFCGHILWHIFAGICLFLSYWKVIHLSLSLA